MPLLFAPIEFSPSYHSGAHLNPYESFALSPRDRYLAALAETRAAEAQYLQHLRRQQAEQALARRRREEFARTQLLRNYVYGDFGDVDFGHQCRQPSGHCRPNYASAVPSCSCSHAQPQPAFGRQLECGRQPLRRQEEMGLKRKQQARQDAEAFARLLGVLLGGLNSCAPPDVQTRQQPKPVPSQGLPENEAEQLEQAFRGLLAGFQRPAAKQSEQKPVQPGHNASTSCRPQGTTPSQPKKPQTLKDELEARLGNEYESEVRDTIHAILASLAHPQPAAPAQQPPSSAQEQGKGKGKDASEPIKIPVSGTTSSDVRRSLEEIQSIETSFHVLEDEFTMPRQLDFRASASLADTNSSDDATATDSPRLSFTSVNAPIHNYTHALSQLLGQLDTIESFGDAEVRTRRKLVVEMVEKALEGVESEIEQKGSLSRRQSQAFAPHASPQSEVEPIAPIAEGEVATPRPSVPDIFVHAPGDNSESVASSTEPAEDVTRPFASLTVNETSAAAEKIEESRGIVSVEGIATSEKPVTPFEASSEAVEDSTSTLAPAPAALPLDKNEDDLAGADADKVTPYVVSDEQLPTTLSTPAVEDSAVDPPGYTLKGDNIESRPVEEIDTFLLPAYPEPASPAAGQAAGEEDLVVVEENSDKDGWSDIGA